MTDEERQELERFAEEEVRRVKAKAEARKRKPKSANGFPPEPPPRVEEHAEPVGPNGEAQRPVLKYSANLLHLALREANLALFAAFDGVILQYDSQLVVVARIPRTEREGAFTAGIRPLRAASLRPMLVQAVDFHRYDVRQNDWIPCGPPPAVGEALLAAPDTTAARPLAGVTSMPLLRRDGSIRTEPGYDAASGMFVFEPPPMPPIPDRPNRAEALAAVHRIDQNILAGFPFADEMPGFEYESPSRSAALSGLLTPVARSAIRGAVPMHLTTAPEAGSGKTYYDELVSILATGETAYPMAAGVTPEETEKRLVGDLLSGAAIVIIDNWNGDIMGDVLAQASSSDGLSLRALGSSDKHLITNKVCVYINGINPTLGSREFERRIIHIRLEANTETPWLQEFPSKPKAVLMADRGRYVADALTVIRYAIQNNTRPAKPYAAYEGWDLMVRGVLMDLGYRDPVESQESLTVSPGETQLLADMFAAMGEELAANSAFTPGEILDRATWKDEIIDPQTGDKNFVSAFPKLLAALLELGTIRGVATMPSSQRLGRWLTKNRGKIVGGWKLSGTIDPHTKRGTYGVTKTGQTI